MFIYENDVEKIDPFLCTSVVNTTTQRNILNINCTIPARYITMINNVCVEYYELNYKVIQI
jgi:hypothetical protein